MKKILIMLLILIATSLKAYTQDTLSLNIKTYSEIFDKAFKNY